MVAHHQQEMKDLSDVEYAMQLRYDERETNAEEDHQSLMDELKNKVGQCSIKHRLIAKTISLFYDAKPQGRHFGLKMAIYFYRSFCPLVAS